MRLFFQLIAAATLCAVFAIAVISGAIAQDGRVIKIDVIDRTATGPDIERAGGAEVVRIKQGDKVELRWSSDEATELHLHGYNVEIEVTAQGESVMNVDARAAGRFAVEGHGFGGDHDAKKTLLYLEVLPR